MRIEEVVPVARSLVSKIAARAEETEAARRLLPDAQSELREAGLFRLLQPRRWGGYELEPASLVKASAELSRGCGSTGWCLGVLAAHNWVLGLYDGSAQEDVWGEDPDTLLAASFAPTGQAERIGDEIRVSGRWSFASGCDAARWVMVSAVVPSKDSTPELRLLLVPAEQYHIDDNWHVSGLAGTGSKDIVIDGAVVPEHRSLSLVDAMAGRSPGRDLYAHSSLYRVPFGTMLLFALVGPSLGLAQGAYAAFLERARTRHITYSAEKQSEQTTVHVMLGQATYQLDTVELLWERDLDEIARLARDKQDFTVGQRARYKRDVGLGLRTCQRVIASLASASGAHGLFLSNPIQRALRDSIAMTAHAALDPIQAARTMGRVALDLEPATAIL